MCYLLACGPPLRIECTQSLEVDQVWLHRTAPGIGRRPSGFLCGAVDTDCVVIFDESGLCLFPFGGFRMRTCGLRA